MASQRAIRPGAPRDLGLMLIGVGILALAIATYQYRRQVRYLWRPQFKSIAGMDEKIHRTPVYLVAGRSAADRAVRLQQRILPDSLGMANPPTIEELLASDATVADVPGDSGHRHSRQRSRLGRILSAPHQALHPSHRAVDSIAPNCRPAARISRFVAPKCPAAARECHSSAPG